MNIKFKKKPKEILPAKELLNEKLIAMALWECLKDNDTAGYMEILEAHFETKKRVAEIKSKKSSRNFQTQTTNIFKSKNPKLQTLAKVIHDSI